jgi:hypothetical protein
VAVRQFRGDLSLVRQGLVLGAEFGARALEEMARMGQFLEQAIYERGSLRLLPNRAGVTFHLRNPPMRVGAFSGATLSWNGNPVGSENVLVRNEGEELPRSFDSISEGNPLHLILGKGLRFEARVPAPEVGSRHTVRLELQNVAIPPRVWLQFHDEVREPAT